MYELNNSVIIFASLYIYSIKVVFIPLPSPYTDDIGIFCWRVMKSADSEQIIRTEVDTNLLINF